MFWNVVEKTHDELSSNRGLAIKIFSMPIMAKVILVFLIMLSVYGYVAPSKVQIQNANTGVAVNFTVMIIIFLINLLTYSWVFVAWHQSLLPRRNIGGYFSCAHRKHVFKYFKSLTIISLLSIMPIIALFIIANLLAMLLKEAFYFFLAFPFSLMGIACSLAAPYIFLRLCLVLPASALGEEMTVQKSWRITGNSKLPIFLLALVVGVIVFFFNKFASFYPSGFGYSLIGTIVSGFMAWFLVAMINSLYRLLIQNDEN